MGKAAPADAATKPPPLTPLTVLQIPRPTGLAPYTAMAPTAYTHFERAATYLGIAARSNGIFDEAEDDYAHILRLVLAYGHRLGLDRDVEPHIVAYCGVPELAGHVAGEAVKADVAQHPDFDGDERILELITATIDALWGPLRGPLSALQAGMALRRHVQQNQYALNPIGRPPVLEFSRIATQTGRSRSNAVHGVLFRLFHASAGNARASAQQALQTVVAGTQDDDD